MVTEQEEAVARQQVLLKCVLARRDPAAVFADPSEAVGVAVRNLVTEGLAEAHEYTERGVAAVAVRLTELGQTSVKPSLG